MSKDKMSKSSSFSNEDLEMEALMDNLKNIGVAKEEEKSLEEELKEVLDSAYGPSGMYDEFRAWARALSSVLGYVSTSKGKITHVIVEFPEEAANAFIPMRDRVPVQYDKENNSTRVSIVKLDMIVTMVQYIFGGLLNESSSTNISPSKVILKFDVKGGKGKSTLITKAFNVEGRKSFLLPGNHVDLQKLIKLYPDMDKWAFMDKSEIIDILKAGTRK